MSASPVNELEPTPALQGSPSHIVMVFDDNKLANELFGQFDEHLALIEQRLKVDATPRGNHVSLKGDPEDCEKARRVLDALYDRLQRGFDIAQGDVEGTIRMIDAEGEQLELPDVGRKGRLDMATISTRRKTITARTPTQDAYLRALDKADLTFACGPAGTGKTYLAVAYAAALLERGQVDRIILSRPAVEAGERLGFLPGDMRDKVDPYLRPLYDALYDMMAPEKVERELESGAIEVAPLAFMRGRTLSNSVIILDEAQNTTAMQMKMLLTRLGEGSTMIITGDPTQVDLPRGMQSGLVEAMRILRNVPNVVQIRFADEDVVRHPLVAAIVKAYDQAARRKAESIRDAALAADGDESDNDDD